MVESDEDKEATGYRDKDVETEGWRNQVRRVRNEYVKGSLGVTDIGHKLEENRLRWK